MRIALSISICLFITIVTVILPSGQVAGQATMTLSTSAEAWGLGGCNGTIVNPLAAANNPGAFGIYHLDHVVSVASPGSTRWWPSLVGDMRFDTWSLGAAVPVVGGLDRRETPRLAFSVGVVRQQFHYGRFDITDPFGNLIDIVHPKERLTAVTFAAGFDAGIRIGLGVSRKKVTMIEHVDMFGPMMDLETSGWDIGLMAALPIHRLLRSGPLAETEDPSRTWLAVTPAATFVKRNVGVDDEFIEIMGTDPEQSLAAFDLRLSVNRGVLELGSLRGVLQHDELHDVGYDDVNRRGAEIGFLGGLFYRIGSATQQRSQGHWRMFDTWGVGIHLNGLIQAYLSLTDITISDRTVRYFINSLDIRFDFAEPHAGYYSGTSFFRTSLAF